MQGWFHGYRDALVKCGLLREGLRHRAGRPDRSALHVFRQAALSRSLPGEGHRVLPGIQTIQDYNLVFWWHDGMYFCAASDLNVGKLRELVQLLEQLSRGGWREECAASTDPAYEENTDLVSFIH